MLAGDRKPVLKRGGVGHVICCVAPRGRPCRRLVSRGRLTAGRAASAKTVARPVTATSSLSALVKQTSAVPTTAITRARRASLLRIAVHARHVVVRNPCGAVADLNRFRVSLKRAALSRSVKRSQRTALQRRLAALGAASLTASSKLLALSKTKKCGGAIKPNKLTAATTTVMKSDINGMTVHVALPAVQFVPRVAGGQTFTELKAPNTDSPQAPGTPAIPIDSSALGIPDGATMTVRAASVQSYTVDGVNVFPAQPQPLDQAPTTLTSPPSFKAPPFSTPPFDFNQKAYNTKGMVPGAPADGVVLGQSRDVTIGSLRIPTAQYDPVTDKLKVLLSVNVSIAFNGGVKSFNPIINSPYETAEHHLTSTLLNSTLIDRFRDPISGSHAVRRCSSSPTRRPTRPRRPSRRRATLPASARASSTSAVAQVRSVRRRRRSSRSSAVS